MLRETQNSLRQPMINLTPLDMTENNPVGSISVLISQLITYKQQSGFTRLRITGKRVLEVLATTDQIDRLVRNANSN